MSNVSRMFVLYINKCPWKNIEKYMTFLTIQYSLWNAHSQHKPYVTYDHTLNKISLILLGMEYFPNNKCQTLYSPIHRINFNVSWTAFQVVENNNTPVPIKWTAVDLKHKQILITFFFGQLNNLIKICKNQKQRCRNDII